MTLLLFLGMEMSVSLSQQMNLTEVAALYEQVQADLPEPVRLRVYCAMSWLKQAQQSTESDVQFMCLWVAFNAAYARDLQVRQVGGDMAVFRDFLQKMCRLQADVFTHLVWEIYPQGIRQLLDNQYVFQAYWDHHNGLISEDAWQESFQKAKRRSLEALKNKDTSAILMMVYERIYTLRNQIFHGGATCGSKVNRLQLKSALGILSDTIPVFLTVLLQHPNEALWGKPYYPWVKD